jgi:hypothetical protein
LKRDEGGKPLGSFGVAQSFKTTNELNDITAGPTSGEAVPEVFGEADDKGRRAISAVNRAWSEEPIALYLEALSQPVGGKDLPDGHGFFEDLEVEVRCDHGCLLFVTRLRSPHRLSCDA